MLSDGKMDDLLQVVELHPSKFHSVSLFFKRSAQPTSGCMFRIQEVTPHFKSKSIPAAPTVRTKDMTAREAGSARRKRVAQWCTMNPGFAVVIGSSGGGGAKNNKDRC